MRLYLYIFSIFFLLNISSQVVVAQQQNDSTLIIHDSEQQIKELSEKAQKIETDSSLRDRPFKAAVYSAVLPGLGQIYNHKYWKLPIIYGLATFTGFLLHRNNQLYIESRDALLIEKDGDDRTQLSEPLNRFDVNDLERRTDFYRRNRDLTIIWSVALYFIQIVDAHVDAHLSEFEISDDLSLNFEPSTEQYLPGTTNYGLTMKITF